MTTQTEANYQEQPRRKVIYRSASEAVYGFGVLGALVYFLQHATTLWLGLFGVLKALVWPALVVYRVLELLKL